MENQRDETSDSPEPVRPAVPMLDYCRPITNRRGRTGYQVLSGIVSWVVGSCIGLGGMGLLIGGVTRLESAEGWLQSGCGLLFLFLAFGRFKSMRRCFRGEY